MIELEKKFSPIRYYAKLKVEESEDGKRLDQVLQSFFESFSREQIKKKISKGDIKIIGRPHPHKPSVKVYHQEEIEVTTERGNLEDEFWRGDKIQFEEPRVIAENEHYIAISKPPYMSTHPTGKHLFFCATVVMADQLSQPVYSIHRLDRETSGVLLLGKSVVGTQVLTEAFEKRLTQKVYLFLSQASVNTKEFVAQERLGTKDQFIPRLFVHCFPKNSNLGKSAETKFIHILKHGEINLWMALPKTGRQHQIRAHAFFHNIPLVGDKLYNEDPLTFGRFKDEVPLESDFDRMMMDRHALHAFALQIPKTQVNEEAILCAPMPIDFVATLKSQGDFDEQKVESILYDLLKKELR